MIDVGTNNEKLLKDPLCKSLCPLYWRCCKRHHQQIAHFYLFDKCTSFLAIYHSLIFIFQFSFFALGLGSSGKGFGRVMRGLGTSSNGDKKRKI